MTGEYWGFMVKNQVSHQVSQFAKMRPLGSLRPLAEGYGGIKVKTVLPYDRTFPQIYREDDFFRKGVAIVFFLSAECSE